jgi:outer membrane receptor for ferrienterochelin and colicins
MYQNRKQYHHATNSTEKYHGNLGSFHRINKLFLDVDYTGNLYGPMFTALGDLDPRNHSPTWEHSKYTITFNKFKI